ncbi:MAG: EF-hand domain-containing protein [Planctomycetota bacterium]
MTHPVSIAPATLAAAALLTLGCQQTQEVMSDFENNTFDAIDSNGDGMLSRPEIQQSDFAQQLQKQIDDDKKLDADGDGFLTQDEFKNADLQANP